MAKEPTPPSMQQGDTEEPPTQPGDSHAPTRLTQHQLGDGKNHTPRRFTDWASI